MLIEIRPNILVHCLDSDSIGHSFVNKTFINMNEMLTIPKIRCLVVYKTVSMALLLLLLLALTPASWAQTPEIRLQRIPDEGIQPRILQDENGNTHLLYFKKRFPNPQSRDGDLYYRQYDRALGNWGNPVKVSSSSFNHLDSIGRAGFAIDGEGRVQVIWYQTRPSHYFHARSNTARTEFEVQRSIISVNIEGVDAGAEVAAKENQVVIVWAAGNLQREMERTVFARISLDYGQSFSDEIMIGNKSLGACACCSLAAQFDSQGKLLVAYRSAVDGIGRHMQLLTVTPVSSAPNESYYTTLHDLQRWELAACPVTTNDFIQDLHNNSWLVFENESRIVELNITAGTLPALIAEPLTKTRQKNPAMAFDLQGNRLIVWAEGISFSRGGYLNWQLLDVDGKKPGSEAVPEIAVPDYSFPAVMTLPEGGFVILY
jgi:hypothetical protein